MSKPARLFTPPAPTGNLTERQAFVYGHLQAHTARGNGLAADEVGALLCERAGRHDAGSRCEWDAVDGHSVLRALRKKGLVKNRRAMGWVALQAGGAGSPSPESDPFPEGF